MDLELEISKVSQFKILLALDLDSSSALKLGYLLDFQLALQLDLSRALASRILKVLSFVFLLGLELEISSALELAFLLTF